METITIPAYAAGTLGEGVTLTAPEQWHERIAALAAFTVYGESFRRAVLSELLDMSRSVRDGYSALAYDRLMSAERLARVTA